MGNLGQANVALLVGERHADWSKWLRDLGDEVEIVLQGRDETPTSLAQRVRATLQGIVDAGHTLSVMTLAGNDGADPEAMAARSLMVRAATPYMVQSGGGEVVLDPPTEGDRGRLAMRALADVMGEQLKGTGVTVEVSRPERPSGIFPVLPTAARTAAR